MCDPVIDINLMSYIIRLSALSLTSNKWLSHEGHSVASITGDMDTDDRADVVEAFNEDLKFKNSTNTIQRSPDILIGTTSLIGQGFTLTRAFRIILMGPEWLAGDEDQCVGRIRRLGQNNRCTISYRLIGKGVKVEEGILNRQALRKEFDRMALELQEESRDANPIVLSGDEA
jgi:SNF2 family DNA or RNA helicase